MEDKWKRIPNLEKRDGDNCRQFAPEFDLIFDLTYYYQGDI